MESSGRKGTVAVREWVDKARGAVGESGEEGVQMRSGDELNSVRGGGKLELQLGKKGKLQRAEDGEGRFLKQRAQEEG